MSADTPIVTETALARTFDGGAHRDAWEIVQQYRRAIAYAMRKDCGSGAVASALDVPRGRVRTWLDGGAPDPVHAIEAARDRGWLELSFDDPEFVGLNVLVADVFSGGSIRTHHYVPSFTLTDRNQNAHLFDAFELANVEFDIVRESDADRATEARPTTDATTLGRVLSVLGAPVGPKAEQRLSLPDYLDEAPDAVRERFVDVYLANRAIEHEGRNVLTIMEERNQTYLRELCTLLDDVIEGPVRLREWSIVISRQAAREFRTIR